MQSTLWRQYTFKKKKKNVIATLTTVTVRLLDLPALRLLIKPPCRLQALDVFIFLNYSLFFPGRDRWGWVDRVKTMENLAEWRQMPVTTWLDWGASKPGNKICSALRQSDKEKQTNEEVQTKSKNTKSTRLPPPPPPSNFYIYIFYEQGR